MISVADATPIQKHANVVSSRSSRIYSDDDPTLISECKRGRSVLDLDFTGGVGTSIRVESQERSGLHEFGLKSLEGLQKAHVWHRGNCKSEMAIDQTTNISQTLLLSGQRSRRKVL